MTKSDLLLKVIIISIIGIIAFICQLKPDLGDELREKYSKSRVDGIIQDIHKDIKGAPIFIVNDTPFFTGLDAIVLYEYAEIGDSLIKKSGKDTIFLFHRINEDSTINIKFTNHIIN